MPRRPPKRLWKEYQMSLLNPRTDPQLWRKLPSSVIYEIYNWEMPPSLTRKWKDIEKSLLSPSMDPGVWSNLPPSLVWEIYKKLPLRDFHQLCTVCKDWNRVACERRSFICDWRRSCDPVHKPYFVLVSQGKENDPTITLAYDDSLSRWTWKHLWVYIGAKIGDLFENFAVEGIIFDGRGLPVSPAGYPRFYFHPLSDIHADPSTVLVPNLARLDGRLYDGELYSQGALGMVVDTSKRPCSFKLIRGSCNAGTLTLDSQIKTWETKPSRMVRCREPRRSVSPKSCVHCDGCMYIWSDLDEIQVYSLEEDSWSMMRPPPRHASEEVDFRGLGHWQGEIYAVSKNEQALLSVWKLIDRASQEWSEFERMPSELFTWLLQPEGGSRLTIVTSHCCEFLLMHILTLSDPPDLHPQKRGQRYLMFNITTKRWEIVDSPDQALRVW